MRAKLLLLFVSVAAATARLVSAEPAQIVVQAANEAPAPKVAAPTVAPVSDPSIVADAVRILAEIKATNAETLKKQEATLAALDELQKQADQLRIFSKRG